MPNHILIGTAIDQPLDAPCTLSGEVIEAFSTQDGFRFIVIRVTMPDGEQREAILDMDEVRIERKAVH